MDVDLPSDCGNSPRMGVVGEFVVSWAKGDAEAVSEWLADDVTWTLIGSDKHSGSAAAQGAKLPFVPDRIDVTSVITHGRLASCDGHLLASDRRLWFSHVIRFANTSKTAKIVELRSYYIAE